MYCFLVSSLPGLKFDAPPPMSAAAFDGLCRETMSVRDAEKVSQCTLAVQREWAPSGPAACDEYGRFEQSLRAAVMRRRIAARKSRTEAVEPVEQDSMIDALVSQAAQLTDPLEREALLDHARFRRLEEIAEQDEFGLGALVAYRLMLLILEKRARLTAAAGKEHFEEAVKTLSSHFAQA